MKKRKFLLLILALLTAFSTTLAVTAFAYTVEYYETGEEDNYDAERLDETEKNLLYRSRNIHYYWSSAPFIGLPKSDGPFYFQGGASVGAVRENILCFNLFCNNETWANFAKDTEHAYEFDLSLLRKHGDKYAEMTTYNFAFDPREDKLTIAKLLEVKNYNSARFNPILSIVNEDNEIKDLKFTKVTKEQADLNGWIEGDYVLRLAFEVDTYQEYSVFFSARNYERNVYEKFSLKHFKTMQYDEISENHTDFYMVCSDIRSYYQVVNAINEAGKLEEEFTEIEMQQYATKVLGGKETSVRVEYLENVADGVPFAKKVQKTCNIYMWEDDTELTSSEVAYALNLPGVNTLISACEGFKKDSDGIFKAKYYPGVYLDAKTEDGKSMQYILNPNNSFNDFYQPLVEDGVITEDLKNYYLNQLITTYPVLNGFTGDQIYGYFGYVVIPETFTFNRAYSELFGDKVNFDGVVQAFGFEGAISLTAYNKLLKDYNYPWLSRIWNDVWGTLVQCNATHVMLYADCTSSKAYYTMNGATEIEDTNGLVHNQIEGSLIEFGEKISNTTKNVSDLLKGRSNSISAIFIVLILGIVVFIVFKNNNARSYKK